MTMGTDRTGLRNRTYRRRNRTMMIEVGTLSITFSCRTGTYLQYGTDSRLRYWYRCRTVMYITGTPPAHVARFYASIPRRHPRDLFPSAAAGTTFNNTPYVDS